MFCKLKYTASNDTWRLSICNIMLSSSGIQKKNVEALFCYEPYDEVVLMQLREFNSKNIISVEKQMRQDKDSVDFDGSE